MPTYRVRVGWKDSSMSWEVEFFQSDISQYQKWYAPLFELSWKGFQGDVSNWLYIMATRDATQRGTNCMITRNKIIWLQSSWIKTSLSIFIWNCESNSFYNSSWVWSWNWTGRITPWILWPVKSFQIDDDLSESEQCSVWANPNSGVSHQFES